MGRHRLGPEVPAGAARAADRGARAPLRRQRPGQGGAGGLGHGPCADPRQVLCRGLCGGEGPARGPRLRRPDRPDSRPAHRGRGGGLGALQAGRRAGAHPGRRGPGHCARAVGDPARPHGRVLRRRGRPGAGPGTVRVRGRRREAVDLLVPGGRARAADPRARLLRLARVGRRPQVPGRAAAGVLALDGRGAGLRRCGVRPRSPPPGAAAAAKRRRRSRADPPHRQPERRRGDHRPLAAGARGRGARPPGLGRAARRGGPPRGLAPPGREDRGRDQGAGRARRGGARQGDPGLAAGDLRRRPGPGAQAQGAVRGAAPGPEAPPRPRRGRRPAGPVRASGVRGLPGAGPLLPVPRGRPDPGRPAAQPVLRPGRGQPVRPRLEARRLPLARPRPPRRGAPRMGGGAGVPGLGEGGGGRAYAVRLLWPGPEPAGRRGALHARPAPDPPRSRGGGRGRGVPGPVPGGGGAGDRRPGAAGRHALAPRRLGEARNG